MSSRLTFNAKFKGFLLRLDDINVAYGDALSKAGIPDVRHVVRVVVTADRNLDPVASLEFDDESLVQGEIALGCQMIFDLYFEDAHFR